MKRSSVWTKRYSQVCVRNDRARAIHWNVRSAISGENRRLLLLFKESEAVRRALSGRVEIENDMQDTCFGNIGCII